MEPLPPSVEVVILLASGALVTLTSYLDKLLASIDDNSQLPVSDLDTFEERNIDFVLRYVAKGIDWAAGDISKNHADKIKTTYNHFLFQIQKARDSVQEFERSKQGLLRSLIASYMILGLIGTLLALNYYRLIDWPLIVVVLIAFFSISSVNLSTYSYLRRMRKRYQACVVPLKNALAIKELEAIIRDSKEESH